MIEEKGSGGEAPREFFASHAKVHSMHLGLKISGVQLTILNHNLWRTGVKNAHLEARFF